MFHNKEFAFTLLMMTGCVLVCAAQLDANLSEAVLPAVLPAVPLVNDNPTEAQPTTLAKAPTTSSTTTTTSTSTTTTTTAKPTTTTTTTTTPAPVPTTIAPAPNTTTQAPVTTTTEAPVPEPSIGMWNSSCIIIKMAAQLNFTYVTKDGKNASSLYNIPTDAKYNDGICDNNLTQSIAINWGPVEAQHTMLLQFDLKNTTSKLQMMRFVLPLTSDRFPNAKENQTIQLIHRGYEFTAPLKMSYHCTRAQKFNLTATLDSSEIVGVVIVHDVQAEAFRSSDNSNFSTARDCDSSETSDLVPIAVGIALAGLISVVLISYLCARRRSTSRGYMSF